MSAETFVIVGAGLAGAAAAAQLRKDGFGGRVLLLGEEAERPYERPPLSKAYLRGETQREQLGARAPTFYTDHAIELWTSTRAVAIEPRASEVVLDDDRRVRYDRLLIASGAAPRRLDLPGSDLPGIHYLRTIDDADAIREAAARARTAVVVGGGWIGAEVAASLRQLGLPVALIAPGSVPLERVLGTEIGTVYRDLHAEHGVRLVMGQRAAAFRGETAVEAVETTDGTRLDSDLVVVGVGSQPRTELAAAAGLAVGDGILVNDCLETSVPGIFAAGDVAAALHPRFGTRIRVEHWDNARRQGRAAARNMMGMAESYARTPYFYSDQYDLGMEYAGFAPRWDQVVLRGDPASGSFIAFWLKDGRLLAGMNANVPEVNDVIAALVASQANVDVERLIDPTVPLDDIGALTSRAVPVVP